MKQHDFGGNNYQQIHSDHSYISRGQICQSPGNVINCREINAFFNPHPTRGLGVLGVNISKVWDVVYVLGGCPLSGKSSMCMMCLKYRIILLIVIKNPWVNLHTSGLLFDIATALHLVLYRHLAVNVATAMRRWRHLREN